MNVFEHSEKKSPSNDVAENKVAGHQRLVVVVITLEVPRPQFSPDVSREGGAIQNAKNFYRKEIKFDE